MTILRIDKSRWTEGLDRARQAYALVGPAPDGEVPGFRELKESEYPIMDGGQTRLSPKGVVFPASQVMMTCSLKEGDPKKDIYEAVEIDTRPRAVVGIRPNDAKALQLVRLNFDTDEYKDPYVVEAYEACTWIGLAVQAPSAMDFSTSCGTGPFDESCLDVMLVDDGEYYLARVLTDKGAVWAKAAGFETPAEDGADALIAEMKKTAEEAITSSMAWNRIQDGAVLDIYGADHWEKTTFACINCGTCTYACPTCWCFDIQDEVHNETGYRIRNWDSCMTSLFTRHGSGHNPRETPMQRTRQRFMHKLKYFPDKYGQGIMCVGCGRCIEQCPAGIDIRDVCNTMNSQA
ncbi:4Fe-4S dicluster domain-containing protein [Desulfoluna butyratoxydans]|uniref:4fe-4s ferredoxin-type iron-sulphur binding domain n=1 Tax=Desulfoluna butyratoxydans TaxID=231438 RepID=A0A4U8YS91_9BACT|nr:4Fe-4S dicluster domain-containing protein [Desulfoluna butyratoxydans]VFQ46771.1 4fe-4s ferredoxin-type iron-sulphur binding domain [Desulfoluna butyratoxydans]